MLCTLARRHRQIACARQLTLSSDQRSRGRPISTHAFSTRCGPIGHCPLTVTRSAPRSPTPPHALLSLTATSAPQLSHARNIRHAPQPPITLSYTLSHWARPLTRSLSPPPPPTHPPPPRPAPPPRGLRVPLSTRPSITYLTPLSLPEHSQPPPRRRADCTPRSSLHPPSLPGHSPSIPRSPRSIDPAAHARLRPPPSAAHRPPRDLAALHRHVPQGYAGRHTELLAWDSARRSLVIQPRRDPGTTYDPWPHIICDHPSHTLIVHLPPLLLARPTCHLHPLPPVPPRRPPLRLASRAPIDLRLMQTRIPLTLDSAVKSDPVGSHFVPAHPYPSRDGRSHLVDA
jgi:hypothetical protein